MRNLTVLAVMVSGAIAVAAQQKPMPSASHHMSDMPKTKMMTTAEKIANAMSAAPSSISSKATILDWPAKEGDKPVTLKAGSNGWSCLPDMPDTDGNDPACLDQPWMQWVEAYMSKSTPHLTRVGVGYMIAPGGGWGSNSEPYAMTKTADNQWGHHEPHVMIVVPDVNSLEGMSTDPNNGGPYVMYAGTPYAHIMAPIRSGIMMSGKSH
jgi:hypothetical protein